MFTVCPKCALTLAVTAGDLRIGQGYVRCGRCASVFNALVALSEDTQAPAAAGPSAAVPAPSAPLPVAPRLEDDLEKTWDPEALPEDSLEFTLGSEEVDRIFIEPAPDDPEVGTGTFETIVLESDDDRPGSEQPAPEHEAQEELRTFEAPLQPQVHDEATLAAANDGDLDVLPEAANQAALDELPALPPPPAAAETLTETRFAEPARASTALPWLRRRGPATAAIVVLGLALLGQWVHYRRGDLAAYPGLNAPLTALYAALGASLVPRWDLRAYEVRQLGASETAGASGQIVVRVSLKNGADRSQPLPLLRLTLHDRYGTLVAGRDLSPEDYLGARTAARSDLEAGERIDTEIALLDPGRDAVGFEIDACLRAARGGITCSADLGTRAP